MKSVGVKKLKAHLSEYLRLAKKGETILVTERDEVVAELRPSHRQRSPGSEIEEILDELSESGQVTRAAIRKGKDWRWRPKGLGLSPEAATALLDFLRSDRL